MDNRNYLEGIYKDFFNSKDISLEEKKDTNIDITAINKEIDELYLDNDSKILIKKIIQYMQKYNNKEEDNYINFNISINSKDSALIDSIVKILSEALSAYQYANNSNSSSLSLYKLDKLEDLDEYYKAGIVVIKDFKALDMRDDNYKNKFIYLLKEKMNLHNMTIIADEEYLLEQFYLLDNSLKEDYGQFNLKMSAISANDIYLKVVEKLPKEVNDKNKIKLLDYIVSTYKDNSNDYSTYIDKLCKYIAFNDNIPEVEKMKSTKEIFKDLNDLVGLTKVKKTLYELVDLITLKKKTNEDLKISNINLHMVFLGNPGTGKTTVARMICGILFDLGYIKENKLIEVSPKDLVGEYVGQTGPKTMAVVNRAMGGVLFIDEAYTLGDNSNGNSYNAEAIATLIKAMEDYRDKLVVIFAGYTHEMQAFLNANSGIVSRIGYTLEFEDYTNKELREIFIKMLTKAGFNIEDEALKKFDEIIIENRNTKNFGNARFVRNTFEKTILKHAANTKSNKDIKILKTITKEDIAY